MTETVGDNDRRHCVQVLAGRTRPMMDAKCPSGYILSGIKVLYEENDPLDTSSDDRDQEARKKQCVVDEGSISKPSNEEQ